MSKFVNSVMVGIVAFLALLSVFWYMSEGARVDEVRAREVKVFWDRVDPAGANVLIAIKFHNPHTSEAKLVRLEQEGSIDQVALQKELTVVTGTIPARTDHTLYFLRLLPDPAVERWFGRQGNETQFLIRGVASFQVATKTVHVPFDYASKWDVKLPEEISKALANCGQADPVCVAEARARWTRIAQQPRLSVELLVRNTGTDRLRIDGAQLDLVLNGTRVASSNASLPFDLAPQGSHWLTLPLAIDNSTLPTWWRDHISNCESSRLDLTLRYARVTLGSNENGETTERDRVLLDWHFGGAPFVTKFVCAGS